MITLAVPSDRASIAGFGKTIGCSCDVRTLANGERNYDQIVFSENEDGSRGVPYMPMQFPSGMWTVGAIDPETDPYEAPFFIHTDAHQTVCEWTLIQYDGIIYGAQTVTCIEDWGYGVHFSISPTTLGCLRVSTRGDLIWLVDQIRNAQQNDEVVKLLVS